MLPSEVGDSLPKISAQGDHHIMTLPLREAREMFERDYLIAQINRFGGNICARLNSSAWSVRRCIAN